MKVNDWVFTRSGRITRNSTSLSCSNGIPYIADSCWSFANNEQWLKFGGGTYEITSLTENEMILSFPDPDGEIYEDTWIKE